MKNLLQSEIGQFRIDWEEKCGIISAIKDAASLEGEANNIGGEVFFYQYDLDIPFNGEEREVFEAGDVVYWRSQKETGKFGVLFMYGNTAYGDGTKPRTSSPGIKIGQIHPYQDLENIRTGSTLLLGE